MFCPKLNNVAFCWYSPKLHKGKRFDTNGSCLFFSTTPEVATSMSALLPKRLVTADSRQTNRSDTSPLLPELDWDSFGMLRLLDIKPEKSDDILSLEPAVAPGAQAVRSKKPFTRPLPHRIRVNMK